MRRREVLAALGAAALAGSGRARAQSSGARAARPLVAFLGLATEAGDQTRVEAFRQGLREVGRIEGSTVEFVSRHAGGAVGRADALIAELMALSPRVFVVPGHAAARAVRRATADIPIVGAGSFPTSDPELFASLARPGGSFTGFTSFGEELSAKQISLLRELLPGLATVGIMHNSTDPLFNAWGEATDAAARAQGLRPVRLRVASPSPPALREQMNRFAAEGGKALFVVSDFMTATLRPEIIAAAADLRLAVMADRRDVTESGALFSYGADQLDLLRRAADYVDRILKGARAGDLAIQLPTKFESVLNLRTARALGLSIPPLVLAQADEVIE